VFSSAALGLAGAATSATFHLAIPNAVFATLTASRAWLTRPSVVLTAVACAVVFAVVNSFTVAVAAHLAEPDEPIKKMLWDRETLLLDLTETCVGILVAVTCALSYLLLLVALPPVILLQRSLMHQQLAAAARTDPKTGLLNATAWQREADEEVARAQRTGSPLALLLVDVDHFKRVNDSHGHLIGDEVLRALAGRAQAAGPRVRRGGPVRRRGVHRAVAAHRRRRRVRDRRTAARQRGHPERGRG
jgi:diguanylate cyclase (GGDEF) domain